MKSTFDRAFEALVLLTISWLCAAPALADERTWTGAGSTANWSESANWSGGKRPANGDSVVIPASGKNASRNDLAGLDLNGLEFRNSTHTLTGLSMRVPGVVASGDAANAVVGLDLAVFGDAVICTCLGDTTPATHGRLELVAGSTITLTGGVTFYAYGASAVHVASRIVETQPSGIAFRGNVEFSGVSTATGAVSIRSDTFDVLNSIVMRGGSLGHPSGVEIGNANLVFQNPGPGEWVVDLPISDTDGSPITIAGGGGPVRLRGTIDGRFEIQADADLVLESLITGTNVVLSQGAGLVTLRNPGNAFTGYIQVLGKLKLDTPGTVPDRAQLAVMIGGELFLETNETVVNFYCGGTLHVLLGVGRLAAPSMGFAGCGLQLAAPAGFAPAPGTVIPVLDSGTAGFGPQFSGLAEGAHINLNGVDLRATYLSSGGNSFAMIVGGGANPSNLLAISQSPASTLAGFGAEGTVRAVTFTGAPIVKASVTWSIDGACGRWDDSVTSQSVQTDSDGYARVPLFLFGNVSMRCVLTATLDAIGSTASFEIYVHRPSEIQVIVSPSEVIVGVGEDFDLIARVVSTVGLPIPNYRVRFYSDARVQIVASATATQGPDNSVSAHVYGSSEPGTYSIHVDTLNQGKVVTVHQRAEPAYTSLEAPLQDMWWGGTAENGWGVSVIQHGNIMFVVVYAYDSNGRPTWYVMPGGSWNGSPYPIYSGPIYSPRGAPFYAYDAAALVAGAPVGTLSLQVMGPNELLMQATFPTFFVMRTLTRQAFGPRVSETRPAVGDMWWGGTSQNGWGIAVLKQYENLFSVWFTYGADGLPIWFVMPAGSWTSATTYEGSMYRTLGSPWSSSYNPAALQAIPVGTFRFRFPESGATFEYTNDGRSGVLPLVRQPF